MHVIITLNSKLHEYAFWFCLIHELQDDDEVGSMTKAITCMAYANTPNTNFIPFTVTLNLSCSTCLLQFSRLDMISRPVEVHRLSNYSTHSYFDTLGIKF